MPISYRIDPSRKLVLTQASGVLTDADILTLKASLKADARFSAGMSELSDIRQIGRLDVTAAGVRAMVDYDATDPSRRGHRLALVVASDEVFGMARMYQMMGDKSGSSVGVFRTIDEAVVWLCL